MVSKDLKEEVYLLHKIHVPYDATLKKLPCCRYALNSAPYNSLPSSRMWGWQPRYQGWERSFSGWTPRKVKGEGGGRPCWLSALYTLPAAYWLTSESLLPDNSLLTPSCLLCWWLLRDDFLRCADSTDNSILTPWSLLADSKLPPCSLMLPADPLRPDNSLHPFYSMLLTAFPLLA